MNAPAINILEFIGNLKGAGTMGAGNQQAKGDQGFSSLFDRLIGKPDGQGDLGSAAQGRQTEKAGQLSSRNLVMRLQQILLSKGHTPQETVADNNALTIFQQMLRNAGYSAAQVSEVMARLTGDGKEKGVRLNALLTELSQLDEPHRNTDSEFVLPMFTVPYVESILTRLGLEPEVVSELMSDAKLKGRGLSLPRLLENLNTYRQNQPPGQPPVLEEQAQAQLRNLLEKMGLQEAAGGSVDPDEPVTLDKFIATLQTALSHQKAQAAAMPTAAVIAHDMQKLASALKRKSADSTTEAKPIAAHVDLTLTNPDDDATLPGKAALVADKNKARQQSLAQQLFQKAGRQMGGAKDAQPAVDPARIDNLLARAENKAPGTITDTPSVALDSLGKETLDTAPVAASHKARPAPRPLPMHVMYQVSRQVIKAVQANQQQLQLQLKPAQLGRLQMNIDQSGDALKIHIIAEQQSARDMLLSQTSELRSTLADQGLRLEKIDVQVHQDFDQAMAHARQDHRRRGRKNNPGFQTGENATGDPEEFEPANTTNRRSVSGLDLLA